MGTVATGTSASNRRDTIVQRAAALFDAAGYHPTSMADIARSVQLAKPSIYHYFRSKEDILFAIHEEFIDILLDRHAERADTSTSVEYLLAGIATDIVSLMHTHRGHIRVFFEHHREIPYSQQQAISRTRRRYFLMVRELIERGVDDNRFDVDPHLAAMAFFGMCNWAYQWYDSTGSREQTTSRAHSTRSCCMEYGATDNDPHVS